MCIRTCVRTHTCIYIHRNYICTLFFPLCGSGILGGLYSEGFAVNIKAPSWRTRREFNRFAVRGEALEHRLFQHSVNVRYFLSLLSPGH